MSKPHTGTLTIPKLDGFEVKPGIFLIGEPKPIKGSDKLSALANVHGALCLIELKLSFQPEEQV